MGAASYYRCFTVYGRRSLCSPFRHFCRAAHSGLLVTGNPQPVTGNRLLAGNFSNQVQVVGQLADGLGIDEYLLLRLLPLALLDGFPYAGHGFNAVTGVQTGGV